MKKTIIVIRGGVIEQILSDQQQEIIIFDMDNFAIGEDFRDEFVLNKSSEPELQEVFSYHLNLNLNKDG